MASFDTINYSLRPNKSIQRQIVFDSLERLDRYLPIADGMYVGFGSIWFSDFVLAHRRLGIRDMISIENKPIGAVRAKFNAPFKTVSVEEGDSTPVLKELLKKDELLNRSWVIWLDYDRGLTQEVLDDIQLIINHAPQNSILIVTLDAGGMQMSASKRGIYLRDLLGDSVSDEIGPADFEAGAFPSTLAASLSNHIISEAVSLGRPGGFLPTFTIPYKDNSPMVTVGGVLPAPAARGTIRQCIQEDTWPGFPKVSVEAPPLTMKEVSALQKLLPAAKKVTRAQLRKVGFDLEEEQLATYCEHYRRYPAFLQVVT